MTKLFMSPPGQSGYEVFKEEPSGNKVFSFQPFQSGEQISIRMVQTEDEPFEPNFRSQSSIPKSPGKGEYHKLIARTIEEIRKKQVGKIVISRPKEIEGKILLPKVYRKLVDAYPAACVYLFSHPVAGTWMGATPETLLKKEGTKLSTMSLAGTRRKGEEQGFSAKEEEEQQMVTDYIAELFRTSRGLFEVSVSPPALSDAGNLVHFKSEISAEAGAGFSAKALLEKLHPTPAVGGFPRKESLEFIQKHEGYDRAYYAGYFGLQADMDFHYFVNLRCMQVFENSVVLYAGGGITKDSDPAAEWEETEAKMRTLLDVIEKA